MNDFYDLLDKASVTPNAYHILWCIYHKRKPIIVNYHQELRRLTQINYISTEYTLTEKGKLFTEQCEELFSNGLSPKKKPLSPIPDLDESITAYLNQFPLGKLPTGKPARVNKKNIAEAFKWFFANYDYGWDTIMKATAYYLDTFEKDNFKFMRNSQYFIRKQNTDKSWDSDLASYCEIILNGGNQDGEIIHEKVV
jgi:hypothetical protein